MGGIFSKPSSPKAAPPPPPPVDAEAGEAAQREKRRRRAARGRTSTVLTGNLGDTSSARVGTSALTGQ